MSNRTYITSDGFSLELLPTFRSSLYPEINTTGKKKWIALMGGRILVIRRKTTWAAKPTLINALCTQYEYIICHKYIKEKYPNLENQELYRKYYDLSPLERQGITREAIELMIEQNIITIEELKPTAKFVNE